MKKLLLSVLVIAGLWQVGNISFICGAENILAR
jgi:hypothetical protein